MVCAHRVASRVHLARLACSDARSLSSYVQRDRFRILFMGRDEFSCEIFKELYNARDLWDEMHITTNANSKSAHKTVISPLRLLGEQLAVPVTLLEHSKDCWKSYTLPPCIEPQDPRSLLVTASFGKIIPNRILDVFPSFQKLNVHGSIVPALRGPAPVQWAIARGLEKTGVSIIELSPARKGIDRGAILGTTSVPIAPDETFTSLRATLAEVGGALLVRVLRKLLAGELEPEPQNDALASHAPAITAQDAVVDWAAWDAAHVDRMHRAISHQRHLTTTIPFGVNGAVKLHSVQIVPPSALLRLPGESYFDRSLGALRIRCANETEVAVIRLQTLNRSATGARDWWNGVPKDALRDGHVLQLGNPVGRSESGYNSCGA